MQRFLLIFLLFLSCGFNPGYTEIFKKYENSEDEIHCRNDEDCQTLIIDSICSKNDYLCKCEKDKVLSSDASKCLSRAKEFGSSCEDNVQCSSLLSSGAICQDNKCSCKSGYHYLRGSCWKNVELNGKCVTDEQCFASHQYVGLECKDEACKCRENYYIRQDSGCRRKRKYGESCNLDEDCREKSICSTTRTCNTSAMVTFSSFSNTTFGQILKNLPCPKGMFEWEGKCVRELGMKCTENADCSHIRNAVCLDNSICACEPVLLVPREDNRECLRVALGKVNDINRSSCQSDSQCEVFGPNSLCKNRRCACKDGTYFEQDKKFCWKIKSLGETCIENRDCHPSVTHAECTDTSSGKQCLCKKGYHQKDSECLPDALNVGDPCENDMECLLQNSFCNATNVCACKKHYYLEDSECKPGVGTPCTVDEDCAYLKNTQCKIGDLPLRQCLCKENHTHSDYKYCLPAANHKEACEESLQCEFHLGDLGECRNESCECREGAHYFYGKCHESKFIGESCSKLQDCFPGNDTNSVFCQKGFCRCNYGYELDKSGICVKTNSATAIKSYSILLTSLLLFLVIR